MLFRIIFLGTSGTIPTVERSSSAIFVQFGGVKMLFDCGEGTQRQMMISKTGFNLDSIFITHLHTDHFIGIFGLIETLSLNEREKPLNIYSPRAKVLKAIFDAFGYDQLNYEVRVHEVDDGYEVKFDSFKIVAFETQHIVESVGYAIVENDRRGKFDREKAEKEFGIPPGPLYAKLVRGESVEWKGRVIKPEMVIGPPRRGRKVVYTGDTRPTKKTVEISMGADLLIHDASFGEELKDWAIESGHSTAREAAEVAREAGVKKLILTHISTRYSKNPAPLLEEARKVFENTIIAEDFLNLEVQFS